MKCLYPIQTNKGKDGLTRQHRCGQCANCRTTRGQEWALRILLESKLHDHTVFTTMTYAPENLPKDYGLCKKHVQDFHKRLRFKLADSGRSFRFFTVGEYGPKTHRPHYHGIYFGLSIADADTFHQAWGHGHVKMDELTIGRASYAAKYCLKKATKESDFPDGRSPEFSLMSRRPGIGVPYVEHIAESFHSLKGWTGRQFDTPNAIRINGKTWPVDPYLRKLLTETGLFKPQSVLASDIDSDYRYRKHLLELGIDGTEEAKEYARRDEIANKANRLLVARVKASHL